MENEEWKTESLIWLGQKKILKPFQEEIIALFEKAFQNTALPEKSFFGTTETAISILTGNIYLAAIHSGKIISLLLDKPILNINNSDNEIAISTKNFESPLFWFETKDLSQIKAIIKNGELWESYYRASYKIFEDKGVTAFRAKNVKNKMLISDVYFSKNNTFLIKSAAEIEKEHQEKVGKAKLMSREERLEILKKSNPKPAKKIVKQMVFNRNEYVVAEILVRANGICEKCHKSAPFLRDNGNSPYLEVHHILPLAEGGDDTVENAIALCPNCHRHAHYGKNTY